MEHGPGFQVTSVSRRLKFSVVILRDKLSNYKSCQLSQSSRIPNAKRTTGDMPWFTASIVETYSTLSAFHQLVSIKFRMIRSCTQVNAKY